jgi:prepilin-type N-terminal cleavage/methylation domain-containing protein
MIRTSIRGAGKQARRGFTLLELMIVMAVISVIALLSIPSLIESQKYARQTNAWALVRQIHMAQVNYKRQNGDYASQIRTLVAAGLLGVPFTDSDPDPQNIGGHWEFGTALPPATFFSSTVGDFEGTQSRFRAGCQPAPFQGDSSTAGRLQNGDRIYVILETGVMYEHRHVDGCSLQHLMTSLSQTAEDQFGGQAYPQFRDASDGL